MNGPLSSAVGNPFSASRVRPGAVAFIFPPGLSGKDLVERLRQAGWRGQIVGPHGSGKSTLLATLLPAIEQAGLSVLSIALHDGQRRLPREFLAVVAKGDRSSILAIDGYEQLSWWSRLLLRRLCHRREIGLLVTSHRPVELPEIYRTAVDLPLARRIVKQLQSGFPPKVADDDIAGPLTRHQGNLREALFDLYDVYETRKGAT